MRSWIGAVALLFSSTCAVSAAETVLPNPEAAVALAGPETYASYRGHRVHRRHAVHRASWRRRYAYGFDWPWWVTNPRPPSCYDRPPFHCPPPRSPVLIPVADLDLDGFPTHKEVAAPAWRRVTVRHASYRHRVRRSTGPVVKARG